MRKLFESGALMLSMLAGIACTPLSAQELVIDTSYQESSDAYLGLVPLISISWDSLVSTRDTRINRRPEVQRERQHWMPGQVGQVPESFRGYVPTSLATGRVPEIRPLDYDDSINRMVVEEYGPTWLGMWDNGLITDRDYINLLSAAVTARIHVATDGPPEGNFAMYTTGLGRGDRPAGVHLFVPSYRAGPDLLWPLQTDRKLAYLAAHEYMHMALDGSVPMLENYSAASQSDYVANYISSEVEAFRVQMLFNAQRMEEALASGNYLRFDALHWDRNLEPEDEQGQRLSAWEFHGRTMHFPVETRAAIYREAIGRALLSQRPAYLDRHTYHEYFQGAWKSYPRPPEFQ